MRTRVSLLLLFAAAVLLALGAPAGAAAPYSENPTIQWENLLGGSGYDRGLSVQQTADGGYVLFGYSESSASGDVTGTNHGNNDLWVVKLNGAGRFSWQQLLGGSGDDRGRSIQQTADGGYILLGYSTSSASGDVTGTNHGGSDCWVVKLNPAGAIQWQKLLGGTGHDYGQSVQQTADGGYVLLGDSTSSVSGDVTGTSHGESDFWVVKLNPAGAIKWQQLLGGSGYDRGLSVQQTADGGYILFGDSSSSASGDVTGTNHGGWDYWVVKLNGAGTLSWQKLLGGSGYDEGMSVQQTDDGGYVLLGHSYSSASGDVTGTSHGESDFWVVKLNPAGAIQWQKLLGGSGYDEGMSVQQTADGGYILLGRSVSSASGDVTGTNHGGWDYWVVKLDAAGALSWQKLLGGSGYDEGMSVQQTADGGYVLLGYSWSSLSGDVAGTNHGNNDLWVVKLKAVPTVRLGPGWNFVSVPAVLASGADMAGIFAGVDTDGHSIFLYNATSKTWTAMSPSTKVKALDGIWIYAKTATTVPLSFDPNPQAVPPVKDLAAGWNAIGYSSVRSATAHDALSSVASKWSTLLGFNEGSQRYETSIFNGGTGDYSDYREMLAGKGYWLYMRESGQISAVGAGP